MQGARGALQGGLNLLDLEGVRAPSVRMDLTSIMDRNRGCQVAVEKCFGGDPVATQRKTRKRPRKATSL
jgi:hypothetical protein